MYTHRFRVISVFLFLLVVVLSAGLAAAADDPLPSWNKSNTKTALMKFVHRATDKSSEDFVPVAERIAVFDNDGTLWAEQPLYVQAFYALDRIKAMAADNPEWKTTEPFKSAINGDVKGLMASGQEGVMKVILTAHAGVTAEEFSQSVRDWLKNTKHPVTGMSFTQMVYQPMLELLDYLRANDFKVYIVSGGGVDFMRVFSEEVYGVPPEQVIGTTLDVKVEMRDGIPTIVKTDKLVLLDDKEGKPVGIYSGIGRRPILAGGNSDGDLQMLQYTTIPRSKADKRIRLGLIIHHTDEKREFAYDRTSSMGRLDKALDEASQRGWLVVDMKTDWARIYP